MRVAVSTDLGYFDVGTEAAEALAGATAALAEAGIESEPVELDWTDEALTTAVTHLNFLSRSMLMSVLPDGAWDQLTPYIRDWFEDSPDVTVEQWWESWKYGDHMYLELRNKVFGAGFDALVCPTLTRNDIPADLGRGDDADPAALRDMLTFCMTYPFNILGRLPVMSVPIGLADSTGVPIGMQIVGPVEADLVPYQVAASLEAQQGPFFNTHRPTLVPNPEYSEAPTPGGSVLDCRIE